MINLAVNWLPDETFYSICSRQHVYFVNIDSITTTSWLFGCRKKYVHDFTYNLGALSEFMVNTWGTPTNIINEHTIAPFFFPFQSQHNVLAAHEVLSGPKLGSLKYRLGLLTGRFGAEHPLRACTACMASDRQNFGVAYWHLSHQYPGMILCPIHGQSLRESSENRQWSGCFEWLLPMEEKLLSPPLSVTSEFDRIVLDKFATAILDLAAYGTRELFNTGAVRAAYRTALASYGLGRSGMDSAACSLAAYTTHLRRYPPFGCLPNDSEGAATFLRALTRNPRGRCHPLKHLTLITWLFNSLHEFICLHNQMIAETLHSNDTLLTSPQKDRALKNQVIARYACIPILRRPKVINKRMRAEILSCLSKGDPKVFICATFNITISTVNKIMRSEPLVHEAWQRNSAAKKKCEQRMIWEETVRSHSQDSAKQIRIRIASVYAWLYRNDRQWLNDKLRKLPSGRIGNHSAVEWDSRDLQLEADLAAAACALSKTHQSPLTRQVIFSALPKLATALEKRHAYRRTRSLLRDLTGSRSKNAERSSVPDEKSSQQSTEMGDQSPLPKASVSLSGGLVRR